MSVVVPNAILVHSVTSRVSASEGDLPQTDYESNTCRLYLRGGERLCLKAGRSDEHCNRHARHYPTAGRKTAKTCTSAEFLGRDDEPRSRLRDNVSGKSGRTRIRRRSSLDHVRRC